MEPEGSFDPVAALSLDFFRDTLRYDQLMNDTLRPDPEAQIQDLTFTDAAATKVGELIRGEGNPNLMLRVFVQGGGCSGMQYGFDFDENVAGRRHAGREPGREAAGRSDELPVPEAARRSTTARTSRARSS